MPHITIKAFPRNLSPEQLEKLEQAVTQTIIEQLNATPESISIDFVEYDPATWQEKVVDVEIKPRLEKLLRKPGYPIGD
ncbi:hypothetical protein CJP74_06940 [Psittacicella melopsittaci]|uniref:4-oxalocrotonate tautomerase-like domain-containing protein n=1 Tax=Psittacicella melopsittaci TaxID=2028576 RepID=A0A3A1Y2Q4_9GAMM|nr:tautomerase family protein [Psittacicella melopsittaci]RIY31586.1 hypothetical protein CJP74_06940 [Psittacicella melopsittaci]